MDFEELLERYKASPRRENASIVLTDDTLLRYCVCFRNVKVERVLDWVPEPSWEGLWSCVVLDIAQIATLADDVEAVALRQVNRLKGLRLVYPDGTIQPLVEKIITKRITDALS